LFLLASVGPLAWADEPVGGADAQRAEARAAWEEAGKAAQKGPVTVDLRDQAKFAVPEGTRFIPNPEATRVMRAMGNVVGSEFVGLAVGPGGWIASLDFYDKGYIKDDDAKNWDVDELLNNLTKGTEAANEDRRRRGFPALVVGGWIEKPKYDSEKHTLVWSISAHDETEQASGQDSVNYNTYVLGRDGYLSLDFITEADSIEAQKATALALLDGLTFVPGKRYSDFNASTDHIAAYGLAALVGGVVAKKIGLLALAGAFIAKFAKILVLACAGGFVAFRKLIGGLFRRSGT